MVAKVLTYIHIWFLKCFNFNFSDFHLIGQNSLGAYLRIMFIISNMFYPSDTSVIATRWSWILTDYTCCLYGRCISRNSHEEPPLILCFCFNENKARGNIISSKLFPTTSNTITVSISTMTQVQIHMDSLCFLFLLPFFHLFLISSR